MARRKGLDHFKLPRWEDLPSIDLYLDQVLSLLDEYLGEYMEVDGKKIMTKTMINNYTKNDLLPSPNKKKYTNEHILLLIYIYYLKNVLSINDIQKIINPLTNSFFDNDNSSISLEEIYNKTFQAQTGQIDSIIKDILKKYHQASKSYEDVDLEGEDKEFLNMFSFLCLLSFDIYIKKTIIEKIIDSSPQFYTNREKEEKKKEKDKK